MQRQSLGSPSSKLHIHGGVSKEDSHLTTDDHQKRKDQTSSQLLIIQNNDEDPKSQKKHYKSHSSNTYIHLIPILTLLCFLILYLSSHEPSLTDLAQFNGFKRLSKDIVDSREMMDDDGLGKILENVHKADVLALRSTRNLQEMINRGALKQRFHRKIGDF